MPSTLDEGSQWPLGDGYTAEVCEDWAVAEMAALDRVCFAGHQGISESHLQQIRDNGRLFSIRDQRGVMVGSAQVVHNQMSEAEEPLVRHLDQLSWESRRAGYFEGIAVDPDHRGQGFQRELQNIGEKHLRDNGCDAVFATVRLENAASAANLLNDGYVMLAVDGGYYGDPSDPSSHRCVLVKPLTDPPAANPAGYSSPEVYGPRSGVCPPEGELPRYTGTYAPDHPDHTPGEPEWGAWVSVNPGDQADPGARTAAKVMLDRGYVGTRARRGDNGQLEVLFQRPPDSAAAGHHGWLTLAYQQARHAAEPRRGVFQRS